MPFSNLSPCCKSEPLPVIEMAKKVPLEINLPNEQVQIVIRKDGQEKYRFKHKVDELHGQSLMQEGDNNSVYKLAKLPAAYNMLEAYENAPFTPKTSSEFFKRILTDFQGIDSLFYAKYLSEIARKNLASFWALKPSLDEVIALQERVNSKFYIYDFDVELKQMALRKGLVKSAADFLRLFNFSLPIGISGEQYYALWEGLIISNFDFFYYLKPTLQEVMVLHDHSAKQNLSYHEFCLTIKANNISLIKSADDFLFLLKPISDKSSPKEAEDINALRFNVLETLQWTLPDLDKIKLGSIDGQYSIKVIAALDNKILALKQQIKEAYMRKINERKHRTLLSFKFLLSEYLRSADNNFSADFIVALPSRDWLLANLIPSFAEVLVEAKADSELPCIACEMGIREGIKTRTCEECMKIYIAQEIEQKVFPVLHPTNKNHWVDAQTLKATGISEQSFNAWQYHTLHYVLRSHKQWNSCLAVDCHNGLFLKDNAKEFACEKCDSITCLSCKAVHHGKSCEEHQELEAQEREIQGIIKMGAKKCPYEDCQALTEKNGGCEHMICKLCHRDWHWNEGKWTVQLNERWHRYRHTLGPYARSLQ